VGSFVEDAFGFTAKPTVAKNTAVVPQGYVFADAPEDVLARGTTSAGKLKDDLASARKATAGKNYEAARASATAVNTDDVIAVLDARLAGTAGNDFARDEVDNIFQKWRDRLASGKGDETVMLTDFERLKRMKSAMNDEIEALSRGGNNYAAGELGKVRKSLDAALEASSDMYRKANDSFRAASGVIDAADEGSMMATRGRAADNVPRFGAMAAAEQDAARIGYGDRVLDQLERITAPTANRAKPLQSPKRAMEASAIARDPALYADRLGRENVMWETQNRALGGSRTADNLADIDAMDGMATGALGAARSASNLQLGDAVAKVAGMLAPIAKGQNEATRRLIAQALLSGNANVLAPVIKQAGKSSAVRRVLEAIIRQPMREGVEASIQ